MKYGNLEDPDDLGRAVTIIAQRAQADHIVDAPYATEKQLAQECIPGWIWRCQ